MFDSYTSKARYELKVVLLHLWRVNVKAIPGFIYISLPDLPDYVFFFSFLNTVTGFRLFL
jgi:hypothetical protein